jgi:hypothetical protein
MKSFNFSKLAIIVFSILLISNSHSLAFVQQNNQAKSENEKQEEKSKTPLGSLLDDQPTTYRAKQIYRQTTGYVNTITYSQKGNLQRIDTEQNGVEMIVLSRPDKEKRFMIVPSKQGYSELFGNTSLFLRTDPFFLQQARTLAPRNVKIEDLGTETLFGHTCNKYKISFDEANNVKTITIWKAKDLQGLIIRQDLKFLNFSDSVELTDVELTVSESLFDLPKGLKQFNTTQEMFQKKPEKDPYAETVPVPK